MNKIKQIEDRFKGYDRGPPLKSKEFIYGWFPPVTDVYNRSQQKYSTYVLQSLYHHNKSRYINHHRGSKTPVAPDYLYHQPPLSGDLNETPVSPDHLYEQPLLSGHLDKIPVADYHSDNNISCDVVSLRPESPVPYNDKLTQQLVDNITKLLEQEEQQSTLPPTKTETSHTFVSADGLTIKENRCRPKTAIHSTGSNKTVTQLTNKLRPKSVPVTKISYSSESMSQRSKLISGPGKEKKDTICKYPHKTWSDDEYDTVEIVISPPASPRSIMAAKSKVNDYLNNLSENHRGGSAKSTRCHTPKSPHKSEKNADVDRKTASEPNSIVVATTKPVQPKMITKNKDVISKATRVPVALIKPTTSSNPLNTSKINPSPKPNIVKSGITSNDNKKYTPNKTSMSKGPKTRSSSQTNLLKSQSMSSFRSTKISQLLSSPISYDSFNPYPKKSTTSTVRSLFLESPLGNNNNDLGFRQKSFCKPNQYTAYQSMYNNRTQDLKWKMGKNKY